MDLDRESGHDFEQRGIILARSLHDPMGTQGAVMFDGSERDGLFVDANNINAYEFTVARTKDKAEKDGSKLGQMLRSLASRQENAFKSRTGWFVTRDEPTADQRSTITAVSKQLGEQIYAISISTLMQRLCNSEVYLQLRRQAPFGSIDINEGGQTGAPNVPMRLLSDTDDEVSLGELSERTSSGQHALLVGNYGAGKSHSLRELFKLKLRDHFNSSKLTPFPVYINLRDCAGLKTPAEILRRHAEEIGFGNPDGLISAWRAGTCILLLDGFDEIVPTRWFGSVTDLRNVRWTALSPVRRLVEETPDSTGIIVAGRAHYFSSSAEMTSALGFKNFEIFSVPDFNEIQLNDYLRQANVDWDIPDWVPMRPLLLGYLVTIVSTDASSLTSAMNQSTGWKTFLTAICEREARMFSAVRPDTIQKILSRVSTLARSRADITGPVTMEMLQSAFVAVNKYQPDEEGMQLLLRLPGLARESEGTGESRVFVDRDLADTAYGLDLAQYVMDPYDETHPMSTVASWANASSELGVEVAAETLQEAGAGRMVMAALSARENKEQFDAVNADLLRITVENFDGEYKRNTSVHVNGVIFEQFILSDNPILGSTSLQDCVINRLDVSGVDDASAIPEFRETLIDLVDGVSSMPHWLSARFTNCEIARYSSAAMTSSGIMQLPIDRESRIALSIIKKIFDQRGSGRKEGALSRGMRPADRESVPAVIDKLVSQGWIQRTTSGSNVIYVGMKDRRKAAGKALESPVEFSL